MEFALPLAALVFLGAFIPIVGATLSGAVAVLVALVDEGPVTALLVLAAVILVQQVESHILQPLIMGRAVSIHPLAVIVAIAAGIVLAGIVGALIAVPIVAMLNTAIRHLGQRRPPPPPPDSVIISADTKPLIAAQHQPSQAPRRTSSETVTCTSTMVDGGQGLADQDGGRSLHRTRHAAPDPGGAIPARVPRSREKIMGPTSVTLALSPTMAAPGAGKEQLPVITVTHGADQRAALVAEYMPMAARIARGFAGRGEELDDLSQVAMLALVKAAARFDPARGVDFAQYAYPCIIGGLKKHFRDNGWSLHLTRRMQELHLQTSQAIPGLTQTLGRTPTITDLAVHLHLSEQDTRDGVNSQLAYTTRSLNAPAIDGEDAELGRFVGELDARLESVTDRHLLGQHMALLPNREHEILRLRFSHGLRQREIAEKLGISQMQVSRLIARSIAALRIGILAHP